MLSVFVGQEEWVISMQKPIPPVRAQLDVNHHRDTPIFLGADLWPELAELNATDSVNQRWP